MFALPRMAAAARLYRDQPHAWDQHWHNETPFLPANFDPSTDILRIQDLDWVPIISPPRPAPDPVVLDEAILERLKKLPLSKGFHLELDVSYASFSVAEGERPFFPKLALAVERASGFCAGCHPSDLNDPDGAAALRSVLIDALLKPGKRPESIRVQRQRVGLILSNAADALNIPIKLDLELPALNLARETLQDYLSPGPH